MEVLINGVRYIPAPPEPTGKGLLDALEVRFDSDAGDGLTVRQYLHKLMSLLWKEQESFDGKRPFGNSDWEFDLYKPLAKAGFIDLGPLHEEDGEPFNWTKDQERITGDVYEVANMDDPETGKDELIEFIVENGVPTTKYGTKERANAKARAKAQAKAGPNP